MLKLPTHDDEGRGPRGSALILVLLVLLALSAIGMVALRDIARSIDQSGLYRVRTTSSMFGDGTAQFWLRRSAGNAGTVWQSMYQGDGCRAALAGKGSMTDREWERLRSELGGCAVYKSTKADTFGKILNTSTGETGLFIDDSGKYRSFESQKQESQFRILARYPFEGNAPEGFSGDDYCFKMVTFAAEGQLGEFPNNWTEPKQVGRGRAIFKGKIGPVPCE